MNTVNNIFNIMHIRKALSNSLCGLKAILQNEIAFKQEILLTIFIMPLGLYFGTTNVEKAILISCWFFVLIIETINSSIEAIVDRISVEIHPLSKKIKDISSAAVLLAMINAAIIWFVILRY